MSNPLGWRPKAYAKESGFSTTSVNRWIATGELPSILVGGCRYILPEHHEQFILLAKTKGVSIGSKK